MMIINVFSRTCLATIALLTMSGVVHAGRFDELELTIRVMDAEHQSANELINEIQLPKDAAQSGGEMQDKEHHDGSVEKVPDGSTGMADGHGSSAGDRGTSKDGSREDRHERDRNDGRDRPMGERRDD